MNRRNDTSLLLLQSLVKPFSCGHAELRIFFTTHAQPACVFVEFVVGHLVFPFSLATTPLLHSVKNVSTFFTIPT